MRIDEDTDGILMNRQIAFEGEDNRLEDMLLSRIVSNELWRMNVSMKFASPNQLLRILFSSV